MTPPTTNGIDPELAADCHVIERDRTHLDADDQALLKALLAPGASVESVIPEDAEPERLWRTLDTCVRGLTLLDVRGARLKFIIGKLIVIFEAKPSLYKALGYANYSDFMKLGVYKTLGMHQTAAYEARMAAKEWGKLLTPDRYAKIGTKNMNILHTFATGTDTNAELLLQTAERMTVPELKSYAEQRGFISTGQCEGARLIIETSQDKYNEFEQCFKDGRIQSIVGSKRRDDIILAMIHECYTEWIEKWEENERAKRRLKQDATTQPVGTQPGPAI